MRFRLKPAAAAGTALGILGWFYGAAPAWAGGGGGEDLGLVQGVLNMTCSSPLINITNCPQLPTVNQVIVEIAALTGSTPNFVRTDPSFGIFIPVGRAVDAGTLAGLSNPLAFISPSSKLGQPIPTQPGNPAANSFLSATTTAPNGVPTTLNLTFDDLQRTHPTFTAGQAVGDITLPLVVADQSSNKVRDVSATLQVRGTGGTAVTYDILGDFLGTGAQTYNDPLTQLGISFALNFGNGFAEFDVGVPLLITSDVAPAYLFSAAGFEFDPQDGLFDGINPVASFLDASFLNDADDPHVAQANLAIAFDGTTVLSDPVPAVPEPSTLVLLGAGLIGLAGLRRWRAST